MNYLIHHSNPPPPPILPFSPLCLIDPSLPQCKNYISGVGPANCSKNVTPTCEAELFRLNHTLAIDLSFALFIAENRHCDLKSVQPCWESNGLNSSTSSPLGINTGRFQQGSCTINCTHNRTKLLHVCQSHAGFLCDSEYNVGLDGTELKVVLPVCLPLSCRRNSSEDNSQQNDLRAIQICLEQHTCGALSTRARQLVPECSVTLPGCVGENNIWHDVVLILLSTLGLFAIFLLFLRCFHERKARKEQKIGGRNQRNKGEYFVRQASIHSSAGSSGTTELEDPLARPLLTSRYVLSDDLAHQQIRGRFALGARDDATTSLNATTTTTTTTTDATHRHHYQMGSSLTYRNLFFRYLGRRLVLKSVSGILARGSCVAVVGAPDSGATTLLRCLAGRQPKGKLEGSLLIDGRPPDKTRKILLFFFLSSFTLFF